MPVFWRRLGSVERRAFSRPLLDTKESNKPPFHMEVAQNGEYAGLWLIPPEVSNVEPEDCAFLFAAAGAKRQEMGGGSGERRGSEKVVRGDLLRAEPFL